jgi:hypothetical protein
MALLIALLHEVAAESPSLRKLRRTECATSPDESSVAVVDLRDRSAVKKQRLRKSLYYASMARGLVHS